MIVLTVENVFWNRENEKPRRRGRWERPGRGLNGTERDYVTRRRRATFSRAGLWRSSGVALIAALAAAALIAAPAQAEFGFLPGAEGFDTRATIEDGSPADRAGQHPYKLAVEFNLNMAGSGPYTDGDIRDLHVDLPQGLIENPTVVGHCNSEQFHTPRVSPFEESFSGESCPNTSQVGVVEVRSSLGATRTFGVFNLIPNPGSPSQLGFSPFGRPITLTTNIHGSEGEYNLSWDTEDISQQFDLHGLTMTLWGNPWLVDHDGQRGNCLNEADPSKPHGGGASLPPEPQPNPPIPYQPGTCSIGDPFALPPRAYLTLPPTCVPMAFAIRANSWQQPAAVTRTVKSAALKECDLSPFEPAPLVQLNTNRASSPGGLTFSLLVDQSRLLNNITPSGRLLPKVRAPSPPKKTIVALPEGVTINPSVGAGLGVCGPAQYAAETVSSPPGAGCPNDSKIGDFTVESPLFDEAIEGALFLAAPFDNPFGTLVAVYMVAKSPDRGILIKVAGRIDANPVTGRLTGTFDNLPQIPYSDLRIHFREGQRSPLATPSSCGTFPAEADFTAWRDPNLLKHAASPITITAGVGGGPCPSGLAPFIPAAKGGTLSSNAGSYTPFYLHLTRADVEQEIVSYSATFPPGLLAKIAGMSYCSEAAVEAALRRTGVEERDNPSCPASSQIGHTYSGYGLGSVLAYAPGNLYLAGPYRGSSFSVVAVNSALVGPFDLGVIVVRFAVRIDPETAQGSIDATGTDPIPHIIDGIPIHLRDIRAYIDRPNFTINPTSCAPSTVSSAMNGAGQRFGELADDTLATATAPFQAFNCSALGFKPKLSLKLKGGTRRGKHPALRVVVKPRPGTDANIASASVTLPPSLFLDQAHISQICTKPQFARDNCPPGSVYGHVKAYTPLLDEPMTGDAILRSSDNPLPDLVFALRGHGIRIDLAGKIDSVKGGIRGTFPVIPDAPVTKFELTMGAGKHGLLVNSAKSLCAGAQLGNSRFVGHANKGWLGHPRVQLRCKKKGKAGKRTTR
jgi:hypothetical protein